ncbi:hypothetical protein D3C80_1598700 [compost metagenome]
MIDEGAEFVSILVDSCAGGLLHLQDFGKCCLDGGHLRKHLRGDRNAGVHVNRVGTGCYW